MEKSAKTYTLEEKKDIFEYVNNVHLHLRGDEKRRLKRAMTHVWKQNKNIGAFELFIKLYESHDTYDKMNEWFKQYVKECEETPEDYDRFIPLAKHRRLLLYREHEIEDLEHEMKYVLEKQKVISYEDHEEQMYEKDKAHKQKYDELEDSYIKKNNQISIDSEKKDFTINRLADKVKYLEDVIKQLETKD